MPWMIAVSVVAGLLALTCLFVINARALMRDLNERRDEFRARLEHDANAIMDDFLRANETDAVQPTP